MKGSAVTIILPSAWLFLALAAYELKIKPLGTQFTKPLGTSIVFTCELLEVNAENTKVLKLQWIGNDGREIVDSSGRIYLEEDRLSHKLYITDIQEGDNGTYTCSSSVDGVTDTKTVSLQLIKEITFDFAPSPQNPKIDTDGLIVCRVSGFPQPGISWRHKGRRILNDGRYVLEDGALRIRNIKKSDDGIYSCRAEVDADGRYDERKISVVVHVPPQISSLQQTVEEIENKRAIIGCRATGTPKPTFKFYRSDGQEIENTNGTVVDADAGDLVFHSVSKNDEGTYRCHAVNDVGQVSAEVELRVLIEPFIYKFENASVSEGEAAYIHCFSRGDPPPGILLFKGVDTNAIRTEHTETGRISIVETPGHVVLTINETAPADAGVYTCTSSSRAGHTERSAYLTITYKPRFESHPATVVHSWDGRVQNISCRCLAHPAPFLEWLHNDEVIITNATYHVYNVSSGSSYLEIKTDKDNVEWVYGNYTCRAVNELGKADLNIRLMKATIPGEPEARVVERSPNRLVIAAVPGSDGGMRVTGYSVKFGNNVREFPRLTTEDDTKPMPLVLNDLESNTTYVFRIYARNEVGTSSPKLLHAKTDEFLPDGQPVLPAVASLGTSVVVGIIIGVFVVFLLVVDISCYFVNGCGLTMCICVQLCGRTKPKMTPTEIEEGESKEILKETPPDLEPDEAKSSQEDLKEEKQYLAETRVIDDTQVEALEEIVDQPQSLPENQPQPQEGRAPPNRKSILSYGDGRWKDVVHELEAQLGVVKKTRSGDESAGEEDNRENDEDFELHHTRT